MGIGISFQILTSRFWKTNCVIIHNGSNSVVVDPGVYEDEVNGIYRIAAQFDEVDMLYTHFDWDHIVDPILPSIDTDSHSPHVRRWGPKTAQERVPAEIHQEWVKGDINAGITRSRERVIPQLDFTLGSETSSVAGLEVWSLEAPGHTADSMVYVLKSLHLALVGDMLSDIEPPIIGTSIAQYRQSLQNLYDLLDKLSVNIVVPGHGSPAYNGGWKNRLDADLRYLHEVQAAGKRVAEGADLHAEVENVLYLGREIPIWHMRSHRDNVLLAAKETRYRTGNQ